MRSSVGLPSPGRAPVIDPLQLGGIETSVLDNGPGKGVRIAWVNTGGGLRYKVVIDRGLDIADAEFLGHSLTWRSLTGITPPSFALSRNKDWLQGFYGGLLVSCGPLNIGQPFVEDGVEYGLHGTHSNTAARIESITNPDPARGRCEMSITGAVRTARVFNPNVELRRTILSRVGEPSIHIHDRFVNRGNEPVPHACLLHINFGYPLLEPGVSTFCYRGTRRPLGNGADRFARKDCREAPPLRSLRRGKIEGFTYVDAETGPDGLVRLGVVNRKRGIAVKVEYPRRDYPLLGNWQHWDTTGTYVGALEPMTSGLEGRQKDRERGWSVSLAPAETIEHRCTITATNNPRDIRQLLALND